MTATETDSLNVVFSILHSMWPQLLAAFALVVGVAILKGLAGRLRGEPAGRGVLKASVFLTPAENVFFQQLLPHVHPDSYVSCKPRLRDLVEIEDGGRGANSGINQKHVDFVVCYRSTMVPFRVIELDDSSHERADRRERDELVDSYLQAAGIQVVRWVVRRQYPREMLKELTRPG